VNDNQSQMIRPLAVSPSEAARMAGIGRTKLYQVLAANQLVSIKLGSRRLIRVADLEAWLDNLSVEN
jgi:excisionase family DNA binding protein